MHPSFQQRIDELGVLLQSTSAARSEFRRRVDKIMPPKRIRYQVVTKAANVFRVVDLDSGKTRGQRATYKLAMGWAMRLEEEASRNPIIAGRAQ